VAYLEDVADDLHLARYMDGRFERQVVDDSQVLGPVDLLWPRGATAPWIAYRRQTGIALALPGESGYASETARADTPLFDAAVNPLTNRVAMAAVSGTNVQLGNRNGSASWTFNPLPNTAPPSTGLPPRLAFHPGSGNPAILYNDNSTSSLLHCLLFDGSAWRDDVVASGGEGDFFYDPDGDELVLVVSENDYDLVEGDIRQVMLKTFDGSAWGVSEVAWHEPGTPSLEFAFAVDPRTREPIGLLLSTRPEGNTLRILSRNVGGGWQDRLLSDTITPPPTGQAISVAVSDWGTWAFVAHDLGDNLLRAWISPQVASSASDVWTRY
jgi:hypothetical protein